MKNHPLLAALVTVIFLFCVEISCIAQGNLTPPGPPAPTMKTLSQIEPRTPITIFPTNITASGSYYLTTNFAGLSGDTGIAIYTNDVTIDLNGFTLTGVSNTGAAIAIFGTHSNLVVKNGTIKNWSGNGIDSSAGTQSSVVNMKVMGCSYGISTGNYDSIQSCSLNGNVLYGGILGPNNLVKDSNLSNNGVHGIYAGGQDQIVDCVVANNGADGIYLGQPGCSVNGCNVSHNGGSGIFIYYGYAMICNNEVYFNNYTNSTYSAGIYIDDINCRVDGNHVAGNGNAGLKIAPSYAGNIIVRNTAANNTQNYITQVNNDVGPIGTAASSTSPWANISN